MKSRTLITIKRTTGLGVLAVIRTGDHCPVSGWWAPEGAPQSMQFISEGSTMPADDGMPAAWVRIAAPHS